MPALFAISPGRGDADELRARIPGLARGGVADFLLREKSSTGASRRRIARVIAPVCREWGLRLWISDDRELAREVAAQGVHLGEAAGPAEGPGLYGLSLHRGSLRTQPERIGAHHCFFGPVFATPSKEGTLEPIGLDPFLQARVSLEGGPTVYALGGVVRARLPELASAGVREVAGIRLFFGPEDPEQVARESLAVLAEVSPCP